MNLLDCHIGAVIKALPPAVAENTVMVFLSDHGEYAGAHGFVAGKVGTCYEEICKVPLIVVDPTGQFTSGLTPSLGTHGPGCQSVGTLYKAFASAIQLYCTIKQHFSRGVTGYGQALRHWRLGVPRCTICRGSP